MAHRRLAGSVAFSALLLLSSLSGGRRLAAQSAAPPALGKGATESLCARYDSSEHWLQKAVVLLSLHGYWHPVGTSIVLQAIQDRDERLRAFGIEALRRAEPELLPKVASAELVDELVRRQVTSKNELYQARVLEVLQRIAPAAGCENERDWTRWWLQQGGVFEPQEWQPKPQPDATGEGTAAAAQRAFDLYQSGLELMICIDSTGSMQPAIDALAGALDEMVDILDGLSPKLRIGIVHYKDHGELGKTGAKVVQPLGKNVGAARKKLEKLRAMGGGDLPEAVLGGLELVFDKRTKWKDEANKLVILIGDAPPHEAELERAVDLARNAFEHPGSELGKPATGQPVGEPCRTSAIAVNFKLAPGLPVAPGYAEFQKSQEKMRADFRAIAEAGGGVFAEVEFVLDGSGPMSSKERRKVREQGGAIAGSATRSIVEHILVLSFGAQHAREMKDLLTIFFDYKAAGWFD